MLSITDLCKAYSQSSTAAVVLDNLSHNFSPRTCVIGENGSGKSTLLLLVSGLLATDAGTIAWQGQKANQQTLTSLAAIASDSVVIPEFLSAKQVLELVQANYKVAWPTALIEQFSFAPHITKSVDALSAGNLKKLQLISAFMRRPAILLLDEPNIALDEKSVEILWQQIKLFEGCLLVASNEPSLFETRGFATVNIQSLQVT